MSTYTGIGFANTRGMMTRNVQITDEIGVNSHQLINSQVAGGIS